MGQAESTFFELLNSFDVIVDKDRRFSWLTNCVVPDGTVSSDCLWRIFIAMGGDEAAMRSKSARALSPDGFLPERNCLIEFDEIQHFTMYRKQTLELYPEDLKLGFNLSAYRRWCDEYAEKAFRKGAAGYRKPKAEFPFEGGRAAQRALFDAYRDLLTCPHTKYHSLV